MSHRTPAYAVVRRLAGVWHWDLETAKRIERDGLLPWDQRPSTLPRLARFIDQDPQQQDTRQRIAIRHADIAWAHLQQVSSSHARKHLRHEVAPCFDLITQHY